ncbi:MAG: hypothetical protein UX68_C0004G0031 [Parcubacteria group bacterium GW2011_GWA2_46_9]|nr:MAG: hypothetical protein UX68_C0004G0031 [Parcubacteria group bacterium GW2011_GWA2_46_9]
MSPRMVMARNPLLLDLKTVKKDDYHVVAVFKRHSLWGAISKTNHAVLRYREPLYRNIHELVMSYFHEYFMNDGKKTLKEYSRPINLARFIKRNWTITEDDVWYISDYLDQVPHYKILNCSNAATLRRADPIEIRAGKLVRERRP